MMHRRKLTRNEVFKKINHERVYQQGRWDPKAGENEGGLCQVQLAPGEQAVTERYHEIGAWISFMETYLEEARDINSKSDDHEGALLKIRCVAAMAVACLEQHGCPDRPEPKSPEIPPEVKELLRRLLPDCGDKGCMFHGS
jgi:hypothetical protein